MRERSIPSSVVVMFTRCNGLSIVSRWFERYIARIGKYFLIGISLGHDHIEVYAIWYSLYAVLFALHYR